ncbi:MAG: amidohydrolase family protein [Moraxellaceae bacterium]|nr:amidohydrolase family protein [Moraxellaceae bacterium]
MTAALRVRRTALATLVMLATGLTSPAHAQSPVQNPAAMTMPIFDAHLHYNWEPTAHFPLDKVLKTFADNNVRGILATSRPNAGTHALVAAPGPKPWVVPFLRPYRIRADIGTWYGDRQTMKLIEEEFPRGYYKGIGEFHLHGFAAKSDVVRDVVLFAKKHKLMLHAHSDVVAIEELFAVDPQARIIWAHTGFTEPADKVAEMLQRYPGLTAELSYRGGITGASGVTAEWKRLFQRYPDRFLLGSDTWINERWDEYPNIIGQYREWLADLPPAVAEQIAWKNAERLFGPAPTGNTKP